MSLPKLDYRLPITVPLISIHPDTREARVVYLDLLWQHVIGIQDEPFPDAFQHIVQKYGGISVIKTVHGNYCVAGPFKQYHNAWMGYKKHEVAKQDQYKLNISAN